MERPLEFAIKILDFVLGTSENGLHTLNTEEMEALSHFGTRNLQLPHHEHGTNSILTSTCLLFVQKFYSKAESSYDELELIWGEFALAWTEHFSKFDIGAFHMSGKMHHFLYDFRFFCGTIHRLHYFLTFYRYKDAVVPFLKDVHYYVSKFFNFVCNHLLPFTHHNCVPGLLEKHAQLPYYVANSTDVVLAEEEKRMEITPNYGESFIQYLLVIMRERGLFSSTWSGKDLGERMRKYNTREFKDEQANKIAMFVQDLYRCGVDWAPKLWTCKMIEMYREKTIYKDYPDLLGSVKHTGMDDFVTQVAEHYPHDIILEFAARIRKPIFNDLTKHMEPLYYNLNTYLQANITRYWPWFEQEFLLDPKKDSYMFKNIGSMKFVIDMTVAFSLRYSHMEHRSRFIAFLFTVLEYSKTLMKTDETREVHFERHHLGDLLEKFTPSHTDMHYMHRYIVDALRFVMDALTIPHIDQTSLCIVNRHLEYRPKTSNKHQFDSIPTNIVKRLMEVSPLV